eukprot:936007-Amphidinium_carterae.1
MITALTPKPLHDSEKEQNAAKRPVRSLGTPGVGYNNSSKQFGHHFDDCGGACGAVHVVLVSKQMPTRQLQHELQLHEAHQPHAQ